MSDHPFSSVMQTVLTNIKEMVDVNTIVGEPITTASGVTIIPISKVTFGFASGGADTTVNKDEPGKANALMGVGNGAGVSITPISFLVVTGTEVRLLPISLESNTIDKVIDSVPQVIDKVNSIVKDYRQGKEQE